MHLQVMWATTQMWSSCCPPWMAGRLFRGSKPPPTHPKPAERSSLLKASSLPRTPSKRLTFGDVTTHTLQPEVPAYPPAHAVLHAHCVCAAGWHAPLAIRHGCSRDSALAPTALWLDQPVSARPAPCPIARPTLCDMRL